jgi:TolB-like protein/cytochrome c-type biogenesis protein CcmH/NrfG
MAAEVEKEIQLEIAHVLFIDIVAYSKLSVNDQHSRVEQLKELVRATEEFRKAENAGRLLKIATGDGMALVFYKSPEEPAKSAVQISRELKKNPRLQIRMGIHSGPVGGVVDVTERTNVAGAGINMAQRVMDCGDAGHILLSQHVAEDLEGYEHWRPLLHNLGSCEVKHSVRVGIVNLYGDQFGNPQPPKKFQKLKKHRAQLRWGALATALLLLGAIIAAFVIVSRRPTRSTSTITEKSIAVLPLENLSEEKENAYFADGIQDELLSNLAKIKDLKVISRTSVMQYKSGITRNLKEIAQQLGVGNVVEGSVRRSGNHVRVSVQLIDAQTDRHIWVQNYDRTLADSLALQGELATEIAAAVGATLSPQEKARVAAKPTNNTAAYDAYLRGRALAARTYQKSYAENAIQSYQEAVKLDPRFGLAWARLSVAQSASYWRFDPSPARLAAAKDAADHALALDPNLPETHLALGYYRYYGQGDFTGALAEFQQAEQGLPNDVDVTNAIALIQRRLGRWQEAIGGFRRVVELDPRFNDAYNNLATAYMCLGRYAEALTTLDRLLAWEPADPVALARKADVFWTTGNLQAVEPLLANSDIDPDLRGLQALFQRNYAAAMELISSGLAAKKGDERGQAELLLGLSQQRSGDIAAARATYQKAAQDFQRELEKVEPGKPEQARVVDLAESWLYAGLGRAHAGLGEAASAIAEGEKAMALDPTSKNPLDGPAKEESMADIYALLGDADHAIPILKRLLQTPPYRVTPALLRLDPVWDQIRNDPRFQELAAEKKP